MFKYIQGGKSMKKGKLSYKILTSFLALLMVFTSFPIANTYAAVNEESQNLGTVSAITDKKAEIKTVGNKTTVLFNNEIELDWASANEEIQRGRDGWWVGVNLTAPKFSDDEFYDILSKTKYQSKSYGSDEWKTVNGKSFWENQDSDKTNTKENIERFITLWAFVDEANLAKAKKANENIKTEWRFDWNCENTYPSDEFDAEQTVAIEIDPSVVTLKKANKQVYPIILKDASAITDKTVVPTNSVIDGVPTSTFKFNNDMVLNWVKHNEGGVERGKDGWWVGVKANAPDLGADTLLNATYQSQAYGGNLVSNKSFWNNQDSDKNNNGNIKRYIELWAFVNEENLNTAKAAKESVKTLWNFDWNSDGTPDQSIIIEIDPNKVTLKNADKQIYPVSDLGMVTGITGPVVINNDKSNSVTALYNEKVTLQWSKEEPKIGRNADGWWTGIKMTAPTTEASEIKNVKYQSKSYGSDEWKTAEGKSFWNNQDSDKNNNENIVRYIELWAYVKDQAMLDSAKADGKKIVTQWRFDWNGDGVYEQYVNFELDPNKIELDWTERYKLDTKNPAITVNNSADNKEKVQWSADSVTITGTVNDSQDDGYYSGIKEVYCLNGKSEKIDGFKYDYANGEFNLTVSEEGTQEYTIIAKDNSGKETSQKVYAKVDKTAPVINSVEIESESAELKAVKSTNPQIVKIDAKDVQSGIVSIIADGKDVTEKSEFEVEGNGTYTVEVKDAVGKTTTKEIIVNNFDDVAPSASLNLPDSGEATWIKEIKDFFRKLFKLEDNKTSIDSTVTLAVQDEMSKGEDEKYSKITEAYYYIVNVNTKELNLETEVSKVTADIVKNNGTSMIVNGVLESPKIDLKVGESVVFVYAVDEANNVLFDYSNGFVFEETKPQITVKNGETEIKDSADLKMNTAPNFVISVQDTASVEGGFVSGIQEVTMSVNDGEVKQLCAVADIENAAAGEKNAISFDKESLKDILDLSKPGIYDVVITAKDMCNNTSTFSFKYQFDNIKPQFSALAYNKLDGETDWSKSTSVTFKVTDQYTDENGAIIDVSDNITKVEYAIVESEDADLTSKSLVWKESVVADGKFALAKEDVKDGKYTMYVAVRYKDDCGNDIETPILPINIQKDTVVPEFKNFELSVEENGIIKNAINKLTHGTYCNESIKLRVYASDVTSGLNDKATLNYIKKTAEDGEIVAEETAEIKQSADKAYYEYILPLTEKGESFVYENIQVKVADNYCKNDEYPQFRIETLGTDNTFVAGLDEDDNKILEKIESSIIHLENIAPVISEPVINNEVTSYKMDEEHIIYNDALVSTIDVSDADSGLNKITVNVKVNGEEEGTDCAFDVYKNGLPDKVTDVSFVYNAKENTVTGTVNGNTETFGVTKLDESDENIITLTVNAIDNAGNLAEEKVYEYIVDNKSPEVTVSCDNENDYTNQENGVTYTFNLNGEKNFNNGNAFGTSEFAYTYNEINQNTENISESYDNGILTKTLSTDGKYTMNSIKVVDLLGNETTVESKNFGVKTEFVIDKMAPEATAVHFNVNTANKVINFFKFGVFANDVVTATVVIENSTPVGNDYKYTSPIVDNQTKLLLGDKENIWKLVSITPVYVDSEDENSGIQQWKAEYSIDVNNIGSLKFKTADEAGNEFVTPFKDSNNDINITFTNGKEEEQNVRESFFLSENTNPVITFKDKDIKVSPIETTKNEVSFTKYNVGEETWYNKNIVIPVHIEDSAEGDNLASGIYSVKVTVNDQEVTINPSYTVTEINEDGEETTEVFETSWAKGEYIYAEEKYDYNKVIKAYDFDIDTSNYEIKDDASYVIKVVVTDFAGNVTENLFTVYKDIETPYIDFAFSGTGYQDSLKDGKVELVELSDSVYGYYFSNDTKVTITAADENCKKASVGVKSITYYAVDINNGIVCSGKDAAVNEDNQVTFTVPANFKGQIYAYATDFLGNNHSTALVCQETKLAPNPTDKDVSSDPDNTECVIPDKTIVENAEKHSQETHVAYQILTQTSTKDASGYDLYRNAVDVKVTITDTYSGIRSGEVKVTSDENATTANDTEFTIGNLDNSVGKQIDGWNIDEMDGNLVTKISKIIRVTRNSNNILISTSMEDRAGNKTENVLLRKFSIDTVAPEITVRYNNNSASDGRYFKANRTATITVTERNFDPSLVIAQINGRNVSLNWNGSYSDNSNKEGKTYTATITYGSDGDYKFGISCRDRAGNADNSPRKFAGQTAPTDFVIDKTAPVVTVSNTSPATPQNRNYYSKPVQVTITVVEHNWDASKFRITYSENDRVVSKALSWTNNGDTHTAIFTCDSSSGLKYTIDYAFADRAANNAVFVQNGVRVSDYNPDEFYVDQTIPEIRFTGAIEGSHNNGSVESGISLSDTYYDRVEVTLTGKRRGVVLQQTYTDTDINITEFVETTRDKDDYYTISVVAYDKAGNRNENPVTRSYSVNRRGSMFVLSNDAKKLNEGTNSQNVVNGNIIIYEYNVDRTVSEVVELWKNGNVRKLSRGTDYTVSTVENQNGYICNTYSIAVNLFADDAAYRIYITTKDEAGNTSTNTSKESAALSALDKNDGRAPVLSFIKDTTPPVIDINLDITKANSYYSIKQDKYIVTFTIADAGSGLNLDSVLVTYGNGGKSEVIDLIKNEDGSYSIELKGTYRNLSFTFTDNAGNEFNSLVFNSLTVSANPFVRLVANTPLFIGLIVALVVIAIIIIILIAKKKKDDDNEENEETENNDKNK